jgi:hypothetical protein
LDATAILCCGISQKKIKKYFSILDFILILKIYGIILEGASEIYTEEKIVQYERSMADGGKLLPR